MNDRKKRRSRLDPNGFNELRMCRTGPMLYNKNDIYMGGSLQKYGEFSVGEQDVFSQIVRRSAGRRGRREYRRPHGGACAPGRRDGEVHAFEPQRIVFQNLCANLALQPMHQRICPAGGRRREAGTITVPHLDPAVRDNFGGVSLQGVTFGESVPLITLDSLDLPACQLLKVDVEGMEVEVLKGSEQLIETHRPMMYLENDRVERSEELLRIVERLDYSAYWHFPPRFQSENYYGDAENVFGNIASVNILCVPRETNFPVAGLRQVISIQETWKTLP